MTNYCDRCGHLIGSDGGCLNCTAPRPGTWVAETLPNIVAGYNHLHERWWVDDRILVGGSINDEADWRHLRDDFGIGAVLSVEVERTDDGKGIDVPRLRVGSPDDGAPKPIEFWAPCVAFAYGVLREPGRRLYVHCALGNSRSPSVAYAILRFALGLSAPAALQRFQRSRPAWGTHPTQAAYLASAEQAIALLWEAAEGKVDLYGGKPDWRDP